MSVLILNYTNSIFESYLLTGCSEEYLKEDLLSKGVTTNEIQNSIYNSFIYNIDLNPIDSTKINKEKICHVYEKNVMPSSDSIEIIQYDLIVIIGSNKVVPEKYKKSKIELLNITNPDIDMIPLINYTLTNLIKKSSVKYYKKINN